MDTPIAQAHLLMEPAVPDRVGPDYDDVAASSVPAEVYGDLWSASVTAFAWLAPETAICRVAESMDLLPLCIGDMH